MITLSRIKIHLFAICLAVIAISSPARCAYIDIPEAKLLPDNSDVKLSSKVITYSSTSFFYIQEDMESGSPFGGIRVALSANSYNVGNRVNVNGKIKINGSGERYIAATSVASSGSGIVAPLYITNKNLGGADWYYNSQTGAGQKGNAGATGLNNVGLLLTVSGLVTYADPLGTFVYIDDGSKVNDGNTAGPLGINIPGIRIIIPSGATAPKTTDFITATGVCSMQMTSSAPSAVLLAKSTTRTSNYKQISILDMQMVPGGPFLIGNSGNGDDLTDGYSREYPQHVVDVPTFWISKSEVTRAQYSQFISAGGYSNSSYWSAAGWGWKVTNSRTQPLYWTASQTWDQWTRPDVGLESFTQTDSNPVVGVSYYEAEAFCKWAGGRLPTEAEWEKAARWDGHPRVYPWGDTYGKSRCNDWYDTANTGYRTAAVNVSSMSGTSSGTLQVAGTLLVSLDARNVGSVANTWVNLVSGLGNFTKQGSPTLETVDGVQAMTFYGGTDGYIGPISPDSICGANPRTIEAWAYNPSLADEETVVAWSIRGGPYGTCMNLNFGSNATYGAAGHWAWDLGWNGNPPTSSWRHLVYTYDGTTVKVYDNGTLKNSADYALNTHTGTTINIAIQRDPSGVANTYSGTLSIAAVRIHTGVLSADQIKSNFLLDASRMGAINTSPYNCVDMAGNVWEWTQDWYKSYPGSLDPFDKTNTARSIRGGGWYGAYGQRCATRWFAAPSASDTDIGFRVAY